MHVLWHVSIQVLVKKYAQICRVHIRTIKIFMYVSFGILYANIRVKLTNILLFNIKQARTSRKPQHAHILFWWQLALVRAKYLKCAIPQQIKKYVPGTCLFSVQELQIFIENTAFGTLSLGCAKVYVIVHMHVL